MGEEKATKEKKDEDIEALKSQLEEKSKEAAENYDRWLRAVAELENYRKQVEKERGMYLKFANESLIKELLPVLDNLERAINHVKSSSNLDKLLEGVELTLKLFQDSLKKFGVKPIETIGKKFDPRFHEAVHVKENSQQEEDTIVEEYQKGYLLHDRLLRPALVVVAKGSKEKDIGQDIH